MGHQPTFRNAITMSALPPKADMCSAITRVRFGLKADIHSVTSSALAISVGDTERPIAFAALRLITNLCLVVVHSGWQKHGALVALWIGRQIGRGGHHAERVDGSGGLRLSDSRAD